MFARKFSIIALLIALATPAVAGFPVRNDGDGEIPSLSPLLQKITPAVVSIAVRGKAPVEQNPLLNDPLFRRFFGVPDEEEQTPERRQFEAVGSGVIVEAGTGTIITNHHLIENAEEITVTLADGRKLTAKLVGSDPETDIAVIKVKAANLTALSFGDSAKLEVGDFVVAIGNPFGLGQTVTSGIVSALGRSGLDIESYEDFIQTDASINPGNSGGALADLRGRLIGINTAIVGQSNAGIGFAIPANMVRSVMAQLLRTGEVHRGQIGVGIQDLTPELAQSLDIGDRHGALVNKVYPNSPAQQAGIKAGDVVIALNGEPIKEGADLRNRIGLMEVGANVRLSVLRDGKPRAVEVTIGARPKTQKTAKAGPEEGGAPNILPGARVRLAPEDAAPAGGPRGVLVTKVDHGGATWNAGLRPGDVILSANQKPLNAVKDLKVIVEANRNNGNGLLLNIVRGDQALFVLLR